MISDPVFWTRSLELSAAGPDLLRLVSNRLDREDRSSLRRVNQAMRRLMNANVTHIICEASTVPAHELLDVFPGVSSLHLRVCNFTTALDWLPQLSSSIQGMLAKLQRLKLEIHDEQLDMDPSLERTLLQLLNRCGAPACLVEAPILGQRAVFVVRRCMSLCSVTVDALLGNVRDYSHLIITFIGSGTGSQAQARSLRQQLAAFPTQPCHLPSTFFLAPPRLPHLL